LLKSDRSEENYRKMNNLGQLLGIITLSRNKPILFDDIDLKSVLSDATKGGPKELDFIVPFISKILESCANSKVNKII
jgi:CCR4-NOT transcription complex subunit 1